MSLVDGIWLGSPEDAAVVLGQHLRAASDLSECLLKALGTPVVVQGNHDLPAGLEEIQCPGKVCLGLFLLPLG